MAIGWMRLDTDFFHDEKFVALSKACGKAVCYDAIRLYCLCHVKYGSIDLNDPVSRVWLESEMGLSESKLDELLERLAKYRVIDPELLSMGKVTSERLSAEGEKRRETEEKRRSAGKASGEARAGNKC